MYDVIVIGAGPAGIMASIAAAKNNKKVLLIEKNNEVGKKLLITGGSRCNLTNLKDIKNFIKEIPVNGKALYSTLNNFGPKDIYSFLKERNIELKTEDNDRVFPKDNKSKTIVETLKKELTKCNIKINLNEEVVKIINNEEKEVITNKNNYKTKKIIITTGGCSYPQTGSTGDGYKFAEELNQELTELYPAETFLIYKKTLPLEGISLDYVEVKLNKIVTKGSILFTHKGLSGPAIFKISEEVYKNLQINNPTKIEIDLLPEHTINDLLVSLEKYNNKKEIKSFIREFLPNRLADYIVNNNMQNQKIAEISKENKKKLLTIMKNFEITIKSTGTLEQSFVTGGGIDLKNINTKTMESKTNNGIYFAGEVLDLHGHTGGYNITIALSTGYTAGISI
jgi:predicted Rossmann fold flavoprotein